MAYKLTALGEKRALAIVGVPHNPEDAVIVHMYESRDSIELYELIEATRMTEIKALRVMSHLINDKGYVKELE